MGRKCLMQLYAMVGLEFRIGTVEVGRLCETLHYLGKVSNALRKLRSESPCQATSKFCVAGA